MSEKDEMIYLDFAGAVEKMLEGKRVTKAEWEDKRAYCLLKDDILQIHKAGESKEILHPWIINNGDISGVDWYVI